MEKLDMISMNTTQENIKKIQALFPNVVTEVMVNGKIQLAIDFLMLKQELSDAIVDEKTERYQLSWPDKRNAILHANSMVAKTLRPCPEKSVDFENTHNIYIEGDNLEVLKLLQETYLHAVDLIYIDPPYNTGKNYIYKNDFSASSKEFELLNGDADEDGNKMAKVLSTDGRFHTHWLNMMYSR